jgi:dienelactone hydrolase
MGVDPTRVALVGVSAGGFASHALASESDASSLNIRGVISLAGGRGSQGPNRVCRPERLAAAMGKFARSTVVPALWLYSENDQYFSPALVANMRAQYEGARGQVALVALPASGSDGHQFFAREPHGVWLPAVRAFLAQTLQ